MDHPVSTQSEEILFMNYILLTNLMSSSQLLWTKEAHQSRMVSGPEEPKVAKEVAPNYQNPTERKQNNI